MELKLQAIGIDGIANALAKAKQYRLLLEPAIAESICLDILHSQPDHQDALVIYILALLDQIARSDNQTKIKTIKQVINQLTSDYQRCYYTGLLHERRARYLLGQVMSRSFAYHCFIEALDYYQQAMEQWTDKHDEVTLRWNSCIRTIRKEKLQPRQDSEDILVDRES